jgi:hypothetical protein
MLKLYLDNCCYNRPFDDLSQETIAEEAQAKRYIQNLIKFGMFQLVHSYILQYEIDKNPYDYKRSQITDFLAYATEYISATDKDIILQKSIPIRTTGIKEIDSLHLACALHADCDYFLTTDKRIMKFITNQIKIVNPLDFTKYWEVSNGNL